VNAGYQRKITDDMMLDIFDIRKWMGNYIEHSYVMFFERDKIYFIEDFRKMKNDIESKILSRDVSLQYFSSMI
jgi:hypothetical protein